MINQDLDRYIDGRYNDQLTWYSNRASHNKKWHLRYQVTIVALSAIITVTVALGISYPDSIAWRIVPLVASALVAALTGLQKIFRFHENWVEYRTTAEHLKKEQHYLAFRCGSYTTVASPGQLFVERVEALISRQNTTWSVGTTKSQQEGSGPDVDASPVQVEKG